MIIINRFLEIQTNHLISAKRSDLVIVYTKENLSSSCVCCTGERQSKNQRKEKEIQVV